MIDWQEATMRGVVVAGMLYSLAGTAVGMWWERCLGADLFDSVLIGAAWPALISLAIVFLAAIFLVVLVIAAAYLLLVVVEFAKHSHAPGDDENNPYRSPGFEWP